MKSRILSVLKFVIWTYTHPSVILWKSNKKKKSLLQLIYITLKEKLADAKFNNDAAMIKIFIKGLRNAHTLAARVYEKGPQSLADAFR